MLAKLLDFYELYPDILLKLKGVYRASLRRDLIELLDFHGHGRPVLMETAIAFAETLPPASATDSVRVEVTVLETGT